MTPPAAPTPQVDAALAPVADAATGSGVMSIAEVDAAIARQHALRATSASAADAADTAAQRAVAASTRGTRDQRDAIVAKMKAAWQGGHSPQANAIFKGQDDADTWLKKQAADAQGTEAERKAAFDKAIKEFPERSDRTVEDARTKASEDQLSSLISAAAPIAIFAGCMALGGGPICGVITAFLTQLFGGNPGTDSSQQIGDMLSDVGRVAANTCDMECLLKLVGSGPDLDPAQIRELFKQLAANGANYNELREQIVKRVPGIATLKACAHVVTDPKENLVASAEECSKAFRKLGLKAPLQDYITKLAPCQDSDDRLQAICFQAHL